MIRDSSPEARRIYLLYDVCQQILHPLEGYDLPGNRLESLILSMAAKSGKWFKHAKPISSPAFKLMTATLALANVK
jgi:hypothetical protein